MSAMTTGIEDLERKRLTLQTELDSEKTQQERNRLGQFATPSGLAEDILKYASTLLPKGAQIRFLDPAIGTGAFYSALRKVFPLDQIEQARGFEIDPYYSAPTARLWAETNLELDFADFTRAEPCGRFNLLICNPPYVRHHHLSSDERAM